MEIPKYEGEWCTSNCRREGCPHEEQFDQEHGIRRSGLDFNIKHDTTGRRFEAHVFKFGNGWAEMIVDQEQRWGEERVPQE